MRKHLPSTGPLSANAGLWQDSLRGIKQLHVNTDVHEPHQRFLPCNQAPLLLQSLCPPNGAYKQLHFHVFIFFYILEWMRVQLKRKKHEKKRKNSRPPASTATVNIGGSSAIIQQRFNACRWWMWPAMGIDGLRTTNYSNAARATTLCKANLRERPSLPPCSLVRLRLSFFLFRSRPQYQSITKVRTCMRITH